MREIIEENRNPDPFSPLIIKGDLHAGGRTDRVQQVVPARCSVVVEGRREYPHMKSAAHLLGYVGEISKSQLKEPEFASDPPGRIIGQYGIEKTYDKLLRGGIKRKNTRWMQLDASAGS